MSKTKTGQDAIQDQSPKLVKDEDGYEYDLVKAQVGMPKPKRTKKYTFPDIEKGGQAVTIEATSIEEATALFQKGQA